MKRRPPCFGAIPLCFDPPRYALSHGRLNYWTGSGWSLFPSEALLYDSELSVEKDIKKLRGGTNDDSEHVPTT